MNFTIRIPQWGDPSEIEWPEDLDHSGAIDITSGSGGGSSDPVTMNVGTVTTGAAGTNASASITDNGNNSFTLNMTIPRGNTGSTGSRGPTGPSAISNYSLTTNGYVKFTNGLIIQWGYNGSNTNITFPISIPNNVFAPFITVQYTSNSSGYDSINSISKTGIVLNASHSGVNRYWGAIGY